MFYTYGQNNSGGYFMQDDNVDQYICVEANSPSEADAIVTEIVEDYHERCECCGPRWYIDASERDGQEVPSLYRQPITEREAGYGQDTVIIYYANGVREKYDVKKHESTILPNWK